MGPRNRQVQDTSRPHQRKEGPFARALDAFGPLECNVIPVVPGAKHPPRGFNLATWLRRRQGARDRERLAHLFGRYSSALLTGRINGLVALDIDSPSAARAFAELGWDLPPTVIIRSRRGPKYVYRTDRRITGTSNLLGVRGLDLKAEGGYIVLPPADGRTLEAPPGVDDFAWLPADVADLLAQRKRRKRQPTTSTSKGRRRPSSTLVIGSTYRASFPLAIPDLSKRDLLGWLNQLITEPGVEGAVVRYLGLSTEIGEKAHCVIHPERYPSAELRRDDAGRLVYHDWHGAAGEQFLTLPEVYASKLNGKVIRLRGPALSVWWHRLLVDAVVITHSPADVPDLWCKDDPAISAVWDGFLRLLAVKWMVEPDAPTAFSARFAAAWCGGGFSHIEAWQAIRRLERWGYLLRVGEHKRSFLWLPGEPSVTSRIGDMRSLLAAKQEWKAARQRMTP